MRQLFSKLFTKAAPADFSRLHTDMHSHLLPGLDDGVQQLDEALEVIEALARLGYRRLITTPHVMADRYPNTPAVIQEQCKMVQDAVQKAGIPVEIHAAAEYFMDGLFAEQLYGDQLMPLDEARHVLVEISFHQAPLSLNQYLFDMQAKGYKPILAHPERYPYYHQNLEAYQSLYRAGCRFQVNILSITGHYGWEVQQTALLLLRNKMVGYLGTDAHRLRHAQTLSAALRSGHLEKTLQYDFENSNLSPAA